MSTVTWFKRTKYSVLALVLITIVLLFGFHRVNSMVGNSPFLSDKVRRGDIEVTINATGTLEPRRYVEVGAQVSGRVEKIHIEEGDIVEAGQLLIEIDAMVFESRVQHAEASLEGSRAKLQELKAELELAALRANRNKNLFKAQAVSKDALFESQANEKILRAKIRAMKAQIKADNASLIGDKTTLGYAKIYAPIGGTVVSMAVGEGQTLNAKKNAPRLLKIADLSRLALRAKVSEADISRLYKGMDVYFKTYGSGERRWFSVLRQVLPTPSIANDVVLYESLMDVKNDDGQLMNAMTAQVYFVHSRAKNALIVPLGALRRSQNGSEILRKTGSALEPVAVTIGVRNRTHVQVLSGLKEGDAVIVDYQTPDYGD